MILDEGLPSYKAKHLETVNNSIRNVIANIEKISCCEFEEISESR